MLIVAVCIIAACFIGCDSIEWQVVDNPPRQSRLNTVEAIREGRIVPDGWTKGEWEIYRADHPHLAEQYLNKILWKPRFNYEGVFDAVIAPFGTAAKHVLVFVGCGLFFSFCGFVVAVGLGIVLLVPCCIFPKFNDFAKRAEKKAISWYNSHLGYFWLVVLLLYCFLYVLNVLYQGAIASFFTSFSDSLFIYIFSFCLVVILGFSVLYKIYEIFARLAKKAKKRYN